MKTKPKKPKPKPKIKCSHEGCNEQAFYSKRHKKPLCAKHFILATIIIVTILILYFYLF